ncbi:hypothetical protein MRX96_008203 [Rhipicephalus microplus]
MVVSSAASAESVSSSLENIAEGNQADAREALLEDLRSCGGGNISGSGNKASLLAPPPHTLITHTHSLDTQSRQALCPRAAECCNKCDSGLVSTGAVGKRRPATAYEADVTANVSAACEQWRCCGSPSTSAVRAAQQSHHASAGDAEGAATAQHRSQADPSEPTLH